jgi:hypothetical protein
MADIFSKISNENHISDTNVSPERGGGDSVNLNDLFKKEPPLSIWEQANGKPYTAEFFAVDNYGDYNDFNDIDNIREQVLTVDKFVKDIVLKSGLKDTKNSYKEIIDKFGDILELSENELENNKLNKIYSAINLVKKINNLFSNKLFNNLVKKK